jgi:hypothetical protein
MNTHLININDVIAPIPAVHAASILDGATYSNTGDAVYNVQDEIDTTKLDKATIKQLRKNIERLKSMQQIEQMKKVSHFNLGAFFPLGKK